MLRACMRTMSGIVLLAASTLAGCGSVSPVTFDDTPAPGPVSEGQFRTSAFTLLDADVGLDLDGDGDQDNRLPVLLDTVESMLEEAVVTALATDMGTESAEQVWTRLKETLVQSGLPLSAEAYNLAVGEAIRTGVINYLSILSVNSGDATLEIESGLLVTDGYKTNVPHVATLEGTGDDGAELRGHSYLTIYPQPWFSLEMEEARGEFAWNSALLTCEILGGATPVATLVQALLSPIPNEVEVDGATVEVPVEAIAKILEEGLVALTGEDGEPVVDVTLEGSGEPGISAGFFLEARTTVLSSSE